MKIQDIISNAYNSDAIGAKQSIYEAISERAMNFLDVKKNDIAIDLFGDVGSIDINESSDSLEEGAVHPADAHRILTQTGGVDTDHFALSGEDVRERMELAKRHGYVAKGDSSTGRSKFYRTSLHLQRQAAKYKQNEEVEQLDELSKGTLGSYIKKASSSNHRNSNSNLASRAAYALAKDPEENAGEDDDRKSFKRSKNIARAVDKLTKEEFEQLDELSKKTLGSYVKKAAGDISRTMDAHGKSKDFDTSVALSNRELKRRTGLVQAVDKLTKEEFEQLDEELSDNAYKLIIHADNDRDLYKSSHVPVAKNLEKKCKAGKYDHEKAKKLWKFHADRAADSYAKEYGKPGQKGHHIFSVADRKEAASHFADKHKGEMELGNFQV